MNAPKSLFCLDQGYPLSLSGRFPPPQSPLFGAMVKSHFNALVLTLWTSSNQSKNCALGFSFKTTLDLTWVLPQVIVKSASFDKQRLPVKLFTKVRFKYCKVQWAYEYRTSPVFKWSKHVRLSNGPVLNGLVHRHQRTFKNWTFLSGFQMVLVHRHQQSFKNWTFLSGFQMVYMVDHLKMRPKKVRYLDESGIQVNLVLRCPVFECPLYIIIWAFCGLSKLIVFSIERNCSLISSTNCIQTVVSIGSILTFFMPFLYRGVYQRPS